MMGHFKNRLTRSEAADFLGCSLSTFDRIVKLNYLEGTYVDLLGRRFYFTDRLDEWMKNGGTANGKTD